MARYEVVIVGGGVIGLSIGYALARSGVSCVILDRTELGREASWAGAGMLPPQSEPRPGPIHPSVELRSWSARLYPEWSAALLEETGIDNGYRRTGGVDVAWTEAEEHALRTTAGRWRVEGIAFERLAAGDFGRVEPALNPDLRLVYFLPDRAQVRNPRHLRALAVAFTGRGGAIRTNCAVEGFIARGDRVVEVRTEAGAFQADQVIVAAGAWSGRLLDALGVHAPTPPLKGQLVLLRGDRPLLRRIVEHGKTYLVPRDDGRILVGATEEDAGFNVLPTADAFRALTEAAVRLCPELKEARVEATWTGLRPGSFDTRPYIGLAPGYRNVIVASGHKRAGLQLSPATAELAVDLVLGRPPRIDLAHFRIDREPSTGDDVFRS
ncbi:MAG: glycine oxidase ThiO [Paludisphaera borealis]|uniref:glycine oxidase ThiO n=1 Tax=Paludisphaera borealis TaxID=1387353 RepID=UPI00284831DD|nr:glycine oxidase ThiO [Paludisphaera borealis]MDR3621806.1 glycine oxidase ThiO [Paludisphaera borealis]